MMMISKIFLVAVILLGLALNNVNSTLQSIKSLRSKFVKLASFTASLCLTPQMVFAEPNNDMQCRVTLPESASPIYGQSLTSAIYLTAKQDVGFIQAQVRNFKPPAVLTSRTAAPFTFPLDITLDSEKDLTPEGLGSLKQWQNGKGIVVSARLDVDGVAATRNAEDLIGKAIVSKDDKGAWVGCNIQLEDRGLGGRIVTKKLK